MLDKLFSKLKESGIEIDEDDFYYGATTLLNYIVFFVVVFLLSIFLNIEINVLFFVLPYVFLRQYTGGIHLNNSMLCIFMSVLIVIGIPLLSNEIKISKYYFILFIVLFDFLILVFFKTANHKNKGLTNEEIRFYTKKAMKLMIMYFIITSVLFYFDFIQEVNGFMLSASICSIELLILKIYQLLRKVLLEVWNSNRIIVEKDYITVII